METGKFLIKHIYQNKSMGLVLLGELTEGKVMAGGKILLHIGQDQVEANIKSIESADNIAGQQYYTALVLANDSALTGNRDRISMETCALHAP